jgi:catechol 2,3-dioxygenase-like lactoylglutathione lyase family enzyme
MLLDGINHLAMISKDIDRLRAFYTEVFEAEVGPTEPHGDEGNETMTTIRIGPHTELNVFTIRGNLEPDRQTPMWGRGRLDHFGSVRSLFFRDPDGLEGEVLIAADTVARRGK